MPWPCPTSIWPLSMCLESADGDDKTEYLTSGFSRRTSFSSKGFFMSMPMTTDPSINGLNKARTGAPAPPPSPTDSKYSARRRPSKRGSLRRPISTPTEFRKVDGLSEYSFDVPGGRRTPDVPALPSAVVKRPFTPLQLSIHRPGSQLPPLPTFNAYHGTRRWRRSRTSNSFVLRKADHGRQSSLVSLVSRFSPSRTQTPTPAPAGFDDVVLGPAPPTIDDGSGPSIKRSSLISTVYAGEDVTIYIPGADVRPPVPLKTASTLPIRGSRHFQNSSIDSVLSRASEATSGNLGTHSSNTSVSSLPPPKSASRYIPRAVIEATFTNPGPAPRRPQSALAHVMTSDESNQLSAINNNSISRSASKAGNLFAAIHESLHADPETGLAKFHSYAKRPLPSLPSLRIPPPASNSVSVSTAEDNGDPTTPTAFTAAARRSATGRSAGRVPDRAPTPPRKSPLRRPLSEIVLDIPTPAQSPRLVDAPCFDTEAESVIIVMGPDEDEYAGQYHDQGEGYYLESSCIGKAYGDDLDAYGNTGSAMTPTMINNSTFPSSTTPSRNAEQTSFSLPRPTVFRPFTRDAKAGPAPTTTVPVRLVSRPRPATGSNFDWSIHASRANTDTAAAAPTNASADHLGVDTHDGGGDGTFATTKSRSESSASARTVIHVDDDRGDRRWGGDDNEEGDAFDGGRRYYESDRHQQHGGGGRGEGGGGVAEGQLCGAGGDGIVVCA